MTATSLPSLQGEVDALKSHCAALESMLTKAQMHVQNIDARMHHADAQSAIAHVEARNAQNQASMLSAEVGALRAATQSAVSTLAIMIEEIRTGNTGAIPAQMADIISTLSRMSR